MTEKSLILDTNFLQYLFNPHIGDKIDSLVNKYLEQGFTKGVSKISIFESIKNAHPKLADQFMDLISKLYRFEINEKTLEFAGYLHNFYEKEETTRKNMSAISTEDLIIASTAVLSNSLIATSNGNDFPRPFFKEIERVEFYKRDPKPQIIVGYILSANRSVIDHHLAHRDSTGKHRNVLTREWDQ